MSIKQKVKYTAKWTLGKQLRVSAQEYRKHRIIGEGYGGFAVCIDELPNQPIIYSFGVGENVCFDIEMLKDGVDCTQLCMETHARFLKN